MRAVIVLLCSGLAAELAAGQSADAPKVLPFAPSLPVLTKEQSARIDAIIERFIAYDLGKLRGGDPKKILADFHSLGPEAIPQLIWAVNRTAAYKESCPVVVIAAKLRKLFYRTRDTELLDFARETIGSSGGAPRHQGVLRDLRMACMIRKSYLVRTGLALPRQRDLLRKSTSELVAMAEKARGEKLKQILRIAALRTDAEVFVILARAAASKDAAISREGSALLEARVRGVEMEQQRKLLYHQRPEVRIAAAQVIAAGGNVADLEPLLPLLDDSDATVRSAVHQIFVARSGQDFGPGPDATPSQRTAAMRRWEAWWAGETAGAKSRTALK